MKQSRIRPVIVCLVFAAIALPASAKNVGIQYDAVRTLIIRDAAIFDVTVAGVSGNAVRGDVVYPDMSRYAISHARSGDTVTIVVEESSGLGFLRLGRHAIHVDVPWSCDVRVETTTGNIRAFSLRGDLDLTTTTGAIHLSDVDGNVALESSTGGQTVESVDGRIVAQSTTGGILLRDCESVLDLRSSTGSQTGSGILLTGDSRMESTTGRIALQLENPLSALTFRLASNTGTLRVGAVRTSERLDVGDSGIIVSARSTTGDILFD
jgi:hypothetical protein